MAERPLELREQQLRDGELERLRFGHSRVRPQVVKDVELQVAAQRFLDHGAV
jgi:hypothetical protein